MQSIQILNRFQRAKYIISDFFASSVAFLIFNILRYNILPVATNSAPSLAKFILDKKILTEEIIIPFIFVCIAWISGYYNRPCFKSRLDEFINTLSVTALNTLLIFFSIMINDREEIRMINYTLIFSLFIYFFSLIYLGRILITSTFIKKFKKSPLVLNTLIITSTNSNSSIPDIFFKQAQLICPNIVLKFQIDDNQNLFYNNTILNSELIADLCRKHCISQIIVSTPGIDDNNLMRILNLLFPINLPVRITPDILSFTTSTIRIEDLMAEPFINLTSNRLSDFQRNIKFLSDKLLSLLLILILSPLYIILALCIKLSSKGPVFYSQIRIGHKQKPFRIYKFRTMITDAELAGPQLSVDNDPRTTKIGRLLRKYRLDELPQFWNVLRGDMSIVGPRPERKFYIDKILKSAPYYCLLFQVKPGITSWGMVKCGYASNIDEMIKRAKYDLLYLSNMSIEVDIKIILFTIRTVFYGSGK